eukprot:3686002-Prymnesium_polylepis.1
MRCRRCCDPTALCGRWCGASVVRRPWMSTNELFELVSRKRRGRACGMTGACTAVCFLSVWQTGSTSTTT